MSYQVLARKWRPRRFDEMVGQEHVLRALINALDHDRLHHAFLFTGTRGVGKTTIARILAKSLNCEQGVSSQPCGQCSACTEIDAGRFMDLLELDAASHTGVDNMREILDNAQYAPTSGRYKVYLIDEAHMLSKAAFNSMLKTLEEPPPHVKFLLATTDPQKLPVTILSRCLQFNLKRLPLTAIQAQLERILAAEGITHEAGAVALIARAADGSLRDALSLLDQAIAYGGGALARAEVAAMLGSIERDHVEALLAALADNDAAALLARVAQLSEQAPDYQTLLGELLGFLQQIALAQLLPDAVDENLYDRARVLELAQRLAPEDVQLYYQIALIGRRDLPLAPEPRGGFEMILLRMLAFRPDDAGEVTATAPSTTRRTAATATPATGKATSPAAPSRERPAPCEAGTIEGNRTQGDDWGALTATLGLTGMVRELALHCAPAGRSGDTLKLTLAASHAQLLNPKLKAQLEQALAAHEGRTLRLVIETGAPAEETPAQRAARAAEAARQTARAALDADANVRALTDTFNARVLPDTVQGVD
jgi:DNA polymerase-3 subunit gamma/tau